MKKIQSEIKNIKEITWIGLVLNLLLSALKMFAGYFGNSQAVFADGIHSLSDLSTDVAVLIGVNYWSQPPDVQHPHGHKRIETIITAMIGILLFLVGMGLIYNAIITFFENGTNAPSYIALIAALISIISKEILYRWTLFVGQKHNSSAVIANAWHHRSDSLSSIPAAIAVLGSIIFKDLYYLDNIGAIIVSAFILQAAWEIANPAFSELTDKGAPEEFYDEIEKIALSVNEIIEIHKCRTRYLGSKLQLDLHVVINGELTVRQAHDITLQLERKLHKKCPIIGDILIHTEPDEEKIRK
ncbi:MAG: cation diffusion facilitator family transporter [Candidatus Gastranaerophilales bacterium]|nr:cation diffusion facilitator family transporter [Candidatus Gastranaerophilales bacterium]